jgi:aromatic-L-amino-acid/L-tryptophan decarboxylase
MPRRFSVRSRFVTPDEFRQNGYALIDWIAEYIEGIEKYPVSNPAIKPGDVRAMLPPHPPSTIVPFSTVLTDLDEIVVPGLTHWQHPSFFAYFPGNSSYAAILGELASAGLCVQGMSWVTSPACTEVETLMLDWMQELLGLPKRFRSDSIGPDGAGGGGVIQGSASEATLAAILSARWRITGGNVNLDGNTTKLVAYSTSQAHSSIEKGLRIAGIGRDHMRIVAHDNVFAMRVDELSRMITEDRAAGLVPFFVCATRGTTSSTAFDPTAEIAEVCQRENVWLHVDAAMSGIAALVPELRWVNDGLDRVDSYCTNPHKWMGVNFDCDLFWTADRAALLGALSILPEYLRSKALESGAAIDYRDWQIPLGRRFRALKLWFTLRCDGIEPAQAMIREHVRLTQMLADLVDADDRFQIDAPHPLNLLCCSLVEGSEQTDALIESANNTGKALFTRTVLTNAEGSRVSLRFSIGGRLTAERHVLAGWGLLQSLVELV